MAFQSDGQSALAVVQGLEPSAPVPYKRQYAAAIRLRPGLVMRVRKSQFERAVHQFYEAVAIPERWPSALQSVADACGAAGATIIPIRHGPDSAISSPAIEAFVADFIANGWATINPKMVRGLQLTKAGVKGLITDGMMFRPDELKGDRYVNEFLKAHGMGDTAGMVLASFGPELVLPFMLERRQSQGKFGADEIAAMNLLVGPLRLAGALALAVGFKAARNLAESLASALKDLALIGDSGRVLWISPGFTRFIGQGFRLRRGELTCSVPTAGRDLDAAIRRAIAPTSASERTYSPFPVPRRLGQRPLIAEVVPIVGEAQDVFALARAVLIVTDPDAVPRDPAALLTVTFGLTSAEVGLAVLVGQGKSLRDIADRQQITIETARNRLKTVFAKTGTHRQSELTAAIAGLAR